MHEADVFALNLGDSVVSDGCTYKAIQLLGSGGNATTYFVQCTAGKWVGLPFALKAFRRISKPDRVPRFLLERTFLTRCDHPAVMRVFDAGTHGDHPFFIAEYLPKTLDLVLREGSGTLVEKLMFGAQLLAALRYLDEQMVVHRDIKPANIFIKGRGCVLGDFGLLKRLGDNNEHSLDVKLLVETMGPTMPKAFRTPDLVAYAKTQTPLTTKSDLFQLGLVFARIFTGTNPLQASKNLMDPIKMDEVGLVPGELGSTIRGYICDLLEEIPNNRPNIVDIIDAWNAVLERACQLTENLEGKVLP